MKSTALLSSADAGSLPLAESAQAVGHGILPPRMPHAVRAIEPMKMLLILAPERKEQ